MKGRLLKFFQRMAVERFNPSTRENPLRTLQGIIRIVRKGHASASADLVARAVSFSTLVI
jgi:hypothetical protein